VPHAALWFRYCYSFFQHLDEIYLTKEYYLYKGEQQDLSPEEGEESGRGPAGSAPSHTLVGDNVEYAFIGDRPELSR
jgi:hypothetical protein